MHYHGDILIYHQDQTNNTNINSNNIEEKQYGIEKIYNAKYNWKTNTWQYMATWETYGDTADLIEQIDECPEAVLNYWELRALKEKSKKNNNSKMKKTILKLIK
eukprot:481516_1